MKKVPIFRFDKVRPYFANMLLGEKITDVEALRGDGKSRGLDLSPARTPLVTLVGVYFCKLVVFDCATATQKPYPELVSAARDAAYAAIDKNLDALPRLVTDGSLLREESDQHSDTMAKMREWARVCNETISLGHISLFARMNWVRTQTLIASNSLPLQAFLYLCEKRRLQPLKTKGAAVAPPATMRTDNYAEYERLIGALLEDPRVAPVLLQNGRPRTVSQCVQALSKWCGLQSTDGETLEDLDDMATKPIRGMEVVQGSLAKRQQNYIGKQIADNYYGFTKPMRDRVSAREGEDDDALRRFLIWEGTTLDFVKLEHALFNTIRKLPQWGEMRLTTSSRRLPTMPWVQAIKSVVGAGLKIMFDKSGWEKMYMEWAISPSLENAILKLALELPGYKESLEAAYAEVFPSLLALWKELFEQHSFAEELLQVTVPMWQKTVKEFDIKSVYRSTFVKKLAYILCMMPPKVNGIEESIKGKKKNRKQKWAETPQGDVIGDISEGFLKEARPILEELYGKGQNPRRSTDDIKERMGQMTT